MLDKGFDHWTDFAESIGATEAERNAFQAHWNNLAPDRNFEAYTRRERRILRYRCRPGQALQLNDDPVYRPKAQYNVPYKRGENQLSYATQDCVDDPLMRRIVLADLDALDGALSQKLTYSIDIHLFRVRADGGAISPTTSGVHQDGHEWIFMHLVDCQNVQPVVSTLHSGPDPDPVLLKTTLTGFLETIAVHDRRHYHAATEVRQRDPNRPAWRDLLLVNIDKAEDSAVSGGDT
ncbi:MAG: 2OG-Fe dioxygenase family protein [Paracoccaceae bacterium]|nr:2OG-Fe dioxygenase family protein [Paracoccaceae bacterium]